MNNKNTTSTGIGFSGLLTLLFIALKLCKVINWSWVWVLSPIWVSIVVVFVVFIISFIFLVLKEVFKRK